LGATKFFAKAGARVRVTDVKTAEQLKPSIDTLKEFPDIEYILEEHRYEDFDWADLIIKNPALKPDNPYLKYAKEKGKQIETDMGIFLQFVKPGQIIGVTGTKGKSTTASLIYEALKAVGQDIVLAGNIGKSVLDTIPYVKKDTLVILEISSFQLEGFADHQVSPKYAVITNIYPDHLNYYGSMEKYIESKKIIAQYQSPDDFLFIRRNDEITSKPEFLQNLKGQIIYFSKSDLPENFSPKLPGEHNLENFAVALAVINKILRTQGVPQRAYTALEDFQGVEFRLQLIYDKDNIKIYNDTAATNPDATIQALQALPNSILIVGGVNKNLPYEQLAKAIKKYPKAVYFLEGTATDELLKLCVPAQGEALQTYNDLEMILQDIKKIIKPGNTILFSPGAASFNLFQNEFDRGRKFNLAVEKIFGKK
ncbi:MAG: UDP-N-acetylmuramoyl-L-alanine--D-glutamate ligase, partial [Candidatus Daviesbacteria bacterium]|nr:UDP-N-acetylmuramoyl-L-alanine--D-glutamate ligase [Candidatus Daviesbacteria bacterium]